MTNRYIVGENKVSVGIVPFCGKSDVESDEQQIRKLIEKKDCMRHILTNTWGRVKYCVAGIPMYQFLMLVDQVLCHNACGTVGGWICMYYILFCRDLKCYSNALLTVVLC